MYAGDAKAGANAELLAWSSQQELTLTVNQSSEVAGESGALPTGVYDVRVKNPNKKSAEGAGALVSAPPRDRGRDPSMVCRDTLNTISITGSGFLEIDGQRPVVRLGGVDAEVTRMTGCREIANAGTPVSLCTGLTVSFDGMAVPAVMWTSRYRTRTPRLYGHRPGSLARGGGQRAPIVFSSIRRSPTTASRSPPTIFTRPERRASRSSWSTRIGEHATPFSDFTSPERPNRSSPSCRPV
jgi:hypothetical protein